MIDGAGGVTGEARPAGSDTKTTGVAKTPGELLRGERERRRLSVQQAAEDLHLDVRIVDAIESNNFAALGAPVYAKGHLRKYAILLGLAPDMIIARYEALTDVPVIPTPIPATTKPPKPRSPLRVPLIVAAIAVGAVVLWWVLSVLVTWLLTPDADLAPAAQSSVPQASAVVTMVSSSYEAGSVR